MLQTGDSFLRRRLNTTAKDEFPVLSDFLAAGMTDYVAIINRFAPPGVIGEMDGFYSSWATRVPDAFSDDQIVALQRTAPLARELAGGVATAYDASGAEPAPRLELNESGLWAAISPPVWGRRAISQQEADQNSAGR